MQSIPYIQARVPDLSLFDLAPFLVLLIGGIVCLLADAASDRNGSRRVLPFISGVSILGSMALFFTGTLPSIPFAERAFRGDEFGQLGCLVILFAALVMVIMGPRLVERRNLPSGEFYTLILFATLGMTLLSVANELLTAFIALEIMSISLYVLTGIDRRSARSSEASFKYFILGAFASAFLVLGIAFLYGATQTTYLSQMASVLKSGGVGTMGELIRAGGSNVDFTITTAVNPLLVYMGFALLFVGTCFKLSLAPFHMWAPDVYEGANTPTTMMIATGSKVAAVAFLVHVTEALSMWLPFGRGAVFIIGLVAVASMLWGNMAALVQTNIKRMLAYSSVAHTGYTTVGVLVLAALPGLGLLHDDLLAAQEEIRLAIVFYMAGYTLMNVLAFGIAQYIGAEGNMAAYRGLVHRKPIAAFGMAVAMFSLLGIPPTVGFMGKFLVFAQAVKYDFLAVVVIGVLTSVASAFYYLSVVVTMFMREEEEVRIEGAPAAVGVGAIPAGGMALRGALVMAAALVFVFGLLPGLFYALNFTLGLF
jgi:NADH-quinone oxidoreductase subunit N